MSQNIRTKRLPSEQRELLIADYLAGDNMAVVSRRYGISVPAVRGLLIRRGVAIRGQSESQRTHTLNETVFDNPTPAGRYWLGYLMSDGAVVKDKRYDSWQVVLVAKAADAGHVEAFRQFIGATALVQHRPGRVNHFADGQAANSTPHARLSVTSKVMAASLAKYGIVPKKSLTAEVIGLEHDRDFWRGCIDGDGCVTWHKDQYGRHPRVILYGSQQLVSQFAAFVRSVVSGTTSGVIRANTIWKYGTFGATAAALLRVLYDGTAVALPRKATLAAEMLAEYTGPIHKRLRCEPPPKCSVVECEKEAVCKGWCKTHYRRQWQYDKRRAEGKKMRRRRTTDSQVTRPTLF